MATELTVDDVATILDIPAADVAAQLTDGEIPASWAPIMAERLAEALEATQSHDRATQVAWLAAQNRRPAAPDRAAVFGLLTDARMPTESEYRNTDATAREVIAECLDPEHLPFDVGELDTATALLITYLAHYAAVWFVEANPTTGAGHAGGVAVREHARLMRLTAAELRAPKDPTTQGDSPS